MIKPYFVMRKSAQRLYERHKHKITRVSDNSLHIDCTCQVLLAVHQALSVDPLDEPWGNYVKRSVREGECRRSSNYIVVPRKIAEEFPLNKYYYYGRAYE